MKKLCFFTIFFITFFSLLFVVSADPGWWNSAWMYRKNITINNSQNSEALTNYQVFVNVTPYDSDMNSTFKDLRFIDSDDSTVLDYWIENYVSESYADVWINISSIIPAYSTKDIYMYYGNSSVSSASDGDATFLLWDDFNDNSIDTSKWNATIRGTVQEANQRIELQDRGYLASKEDIPEGVRVFASYTTTSRYNSVNFNLRSDANPIGDYYEVTNAIQVMDFGGETPGNYNILVRKAEAGEFTTLNSTTHSIVVNTWYDGEVKIYGDNSDFNITVIMNGTELTNSSSYSPSGTSEKLLFYNREGGGYGWTYFDDVRVAKYTEPEPTHSFGSKESVPKWWNTSFDKCRNITISNVGSEDFTNFPAYINIPYDSDILSDYSDLRFVNTLCDNGGTELDYEIENYTSSNAHIWVRIDSLLTAGKTISIYYDNNTAIESGENPTDVWDSYYNGVWHLREDPSGSAPQMKDSTSNNIDLSSIGGMDSSDSVEGKIGKALDFDGSDDAVEKSTVDFGALTAFSVSGWIKGRDLATNINQFWGHAETMDYSGEWYMNYNSCASGKIYFGFWSSAGRTDWCQEHSFSSDTWYMVTFTFDGSYMRIYIDDGSTVYSNFLSASIGALSKYMRISRSGNAAADWFDGIIDEVRVSSIARSADWINQTYQLIENQNTYVTIETPADISPKSFNVDQSKTDYILPKDVIKFYAYWNDDVGLSGYVFSTNVSQIDCSDGWDNSSWQEMTGTGNWSNYTWTIPSGCGGKSVEWKIYANDTSNNWNFTIPIKTFEVEALTSITLNFKKGWNLISIPNKTVIEIIDDPCDIFSRGFYYYNASKKVYDIFSLKQLKGGRGYWVYPPNTCTVDVTLSGMATVLDVPELKSGYNMVGAPSAPVTIGSLTSCEKTYSWDANEQEWVTMTTVDLTESGKGYWVKCS